MFSQTVEYALRAVTHLASNPGVPLTTTKIAKATKVPSPYLAKVMRALVKGHIVVARRGLGGGMELKIPPDQLSLLEVVNAVDPIRRIQRCPLELELHGVRLCPLHRRLDDALASVENAFRQTTLADILADPNPSIPLCDFPRQREVPVNSPPTG